MKRVVELTMLALGVIAGAAAVPIAAQGECLGFVERPVVDGGTNGVERLVVADIDRDGRPDLVTASFGDGKLFWYENRSDQPTPPRFLPHLIADDLGSASDVVAVDLDGDQDLDLIAASRERGVFWFEQAAGSQPPVFSKRTVTLETELALGVHAADVDGDGHVDVLTASFLDDTIAWYRNSGTTPIEFTRFVITERALGAAAVWAADVDGDTRTDVVAASSLDGEVVLYRQTAGAPGTIPAFDKIVLAGLDGRCSVSTDVRCDIAADCPPPAEPMDQPETCVVQPVSSAIGASSVTVADLDDDGRLDVAAAALNENRIIWYRNDGGQPPAFSEFDVTNDAQLVRVVRVADVNLDQKPDLLSASYGDDTIAWYEYVGGQPPGFNEIPVSTDVLSADDVGAADLDGDGAVDIVSVSSVAGFPATRDRIAWYRNNGSGFDEGSTISRSADGAVRAIGADLDGDGRVDVVTAGRSDRLAWYRNDGGDPPSFTEQIVAEDVLGAIDVVAVDLDGDTDLELVVASADDGRIRAFDNGLITGAVRGAPVPVFTEASVDVAAGLDNLQKIVAVDLDGDGDLDLISAEAGEAPEVEEDEPTPPFGRIQWYENDGGGGFSPPQLITDDAGGARSVHAVDLDEDGDVDVLAALFGIDRVVWLENVPDADGPAFPLTREFDVGLLGPTSIDTADFDGDGDIDIVVSASESEVVALLSSNLDDDPEQPPPSPPAFATRVLATSADGISEVFAADLDAVPDGDPDIVATIPGDDVIVWFDNDGAAIFTVDLVATEIDFASSSDVADLDGDGMPDIVSGQRLAVLWYQAGGETCQGFDASGDGRIDGVELAYIGRGFGRAVGPASPQWMIAVDYNADGTIDGQDLAILASDGVFGFTTDSCSYVCN
ncbi:MAG TPA: FG-GAP-like repeat-containing protein [Candidatus Polarisedimenticolaceae bacterium]|nr:FG-GAP-like repeat-containing protein [Candidatus Polarisedimenticolaceae bacterium]